MKVAMCSMEAVPFVKTGGLGDVVGALPAFLGKLGVDCRVFMPYYKSIFERELKDHKFELIKENVSVPMSRGQNEFFDILSTQHNGVTYYFIKNDKFFDRDYLYGTSEKDYEDNDKRFSFFSKSILSLLENVRLKADIIHLNDYHCALTPVFLSHIRANNLPSKDFFQKSSTVFTIHNLAYQGIYDRDILGYCGLGDEYFNMEALEYYGRVNFMKGGILFSNRVTTVSPTYAKEILWPEYGYGLNGVLKTREKDLIGIINGIDYSVWDPWTDRKIKANYSAGSLDGKKECKKYLLKKMFGLGTNKSTSITSISTSKSVSISESEPESTLISGLISRPVLGIVSRLSEQKGIDLVVEILDLLMKEDVFLVILGSGDEKYIKMLMDSEPKYNHEMRVNIKYDDKLARMIYAGSDIFLMPSKYEPCGLSQLISLKYGTVPVVRNTGGLSDTVIDIQSEGDIKKGGTGFKFNNFTSDEFLDAIIRALSFYERKNLWNRIIKNGMKSDFSWESSAREYKKLYSSLTKAKIQLKNT